MKSLKLLALLVMFTSLTACIEPETRDKTGTFILPEELKERNCSIHYMSNGMSGIYVVTCPNTNCTTVTRVGKNPIHSAVCD